MCCSKKYPYPFHKEIFSLKTAIPLGVPILVHTILKKSCLLRSPSFVEFPITLFVVGMVFSGTMQ